MNDAPIIIDPLLCKGCKKCITACPFDALEMQGKLAVLKVAECRACNACIKVCPFKAISTPPEEVETSNVGLAAFKDIWVLKCGKTHV